MINISPLDDEQYLGFETQSCYTTLEDFIREGKECANEWEWDYEILKAPDCHQTKEATVYIEKCNGKETCLFWEAS